MGGCKCTFRNCTVKSDGQTHMFHYPVFDKVRCHLWLKNAQRLDFLDLKVSQLKNRVVCQYHFRPDNFMNFKMDKLKFDAVPTEPGPFCENQEETLEELLQDFEIAPEDIENATLTHKDKKANFSVKYGEFLTNSESPYPVHTYSPSKVTLPEDKKHSSQLMLVVPPYSDQKNNQNVPEHRLKDMPDQFLQSAPIVQFNETLNEKGANIKKRKSNIRIISEKKISQPVRVKGKMEPVSPSLVINARSLQQDRVLATMVNPDEKLENMEVVIYNPPKSTPPRTVDSTLEAQTMNMTDQSSFLMQIPGELNYEISITNNNLNNNNQTDCNYQNVENNEVTQIISPSKVTCNENMNVETVYVPPPVTCVTRTPQSVRKNNQSPKISILSPKVAVERIAAEEKLNKSPNIPLTQPKTAQEKVSGVEEKVCKTPKTSILKPKIAPERVAAIEEKRNFNKKLRDMIEFCLDDSDKQIKKKYERMSIEGQIVKKSPEIIKNQSESQTVSSHLSKEPNLPDKREYDLAALHARMQKMEQLLLRKIEHNSQSIVELKETVIASKPQTKGQWTQTGPENEESYKKHLYSEISQYLNPEAASLVYEQMFLNKFAIKSAKTPVESLSKKRRYYR